MNQPQLSDYSPEEQAILILFTQLDRTTQINILAELKFTIDWDEPVPAKPPYQWAREGDRAYQSTSTQ